MHKEKCRHPLVVCKVICVTVEKGHVGNAQQHVKTCNQGHVHDVRKLAERGISLDLLAAHFASSVPKGAQGKDVKKHVNFKVKILWQGDLISCVKVFGTKKCKLCARE